MNSVGFASTYSLIDLLEELPLPKALNLRDNDRLTNEPLDFQSVQELQNVADNIAPAVQMARLPSDIDRLRFKDPAFAPSPNIRTHHAQASPLMSVLVNHYQQFQDIMTVPQYNVPYYPTAQSQVSPIASQQQQQQQQQQQPMQQPSPQIAAHHHSQPVHPNHHQIHQQQQRPQHQAPQQYHQQSQQQQQQQSHHHQQQQHQQYPVQAHHTSPVHQPSPQHLSPHRQQHIQPAHHPPTPQQLAPQHQQVLSPRPQYAHKPHPPPISQQRPHLPIPRKPIAPMEMQYMPTQPMMPQQHIPQQQPMQIHHQQLNHHPHPIVQQPLQNQLQPPTIKQTPPKHAVHGRQTNQGPPNKTTPQVKRQLNNSQLNSLKKKMHVKRPEVVIDTKGSSLEEVLEKFVQETISEQVSDLSYSFTPKQLLHLVAITAKLKKKNLTKNVNLNKLTSLMITLSSQLQIQTEVLKNNSYEDETNFDNDDSRIGEQSRMQKFEICCDCAVTALNVMTSNSMDSRVYLEECVEAIINFVNVALTIITDTSTGTHCSSPNKKSSKHAGDRKGSRRILFEKQSLSKLTAKCSEVLSLVHDLLVCRTESTLNDSLLLSTSRAALTAFFLMDSSTSSNELQLNALNVITAIFASYKSHQTVIFEELIHSIARLPTAKRNRVQYQIGSNYNESISIFSALIMKLIQSLFTIRRNDLSDEKSQGSSQGDDNSSFERILKSQYNSALRASYAFVSSFLRRCCGVDKKDDCDYRVLFETFVEDLMTCLYKPDWSSAQLITHVLIKLLISNINPQLGKKNQQSTNQTMKLASLEHLGTICARLVKEKSTLPMYRKEVKRALKAIDLSSLYMSHSGEYKSKRLRHMSMKKEMLSDSDTEEERDDEEQDINTDLDTNFDMSEQKLLSKADEQKFWLALLTFCQRDKNISKCGRNIFCAIWLKEIERRAKQQYEINNPVLGDQISASDDEESNGAQSLSGSHLKQYSRNNNNDDTQRTINGPSIEDIQAGLVQDFFRLLSISTRRLLVKAKPSENNGNAQSSSITPESADEDATIDDSTASNIIKILDVALPTTQKLIDASLSHIVAALSTTANTNIRSRAMKSLSHVLNDAPKECAAKLLARDDLQKAIGSSLLDQSTSVRESTVELIGRFILNSQSETLIDKYYDMLTSRIMDSGVSVRKRVIKILREICINHPSYPRVPEICSIIIKRINDEGEGIRKLVSETFTQMWFKEERTHEAIVTKVACITHVVATVWSKILAEANKSTGAESHFEWLHQLLSSLLKLKTNTDEQTNHAAKRRPKASESEQNEDGEPIAPEVENLKQTLAASTQIISVLISEKLSNGLQETNSRADCLAAMTTLWAFAKISPLLLTHYLDLFQSFLHVEPKSSFDLLILEKVIQIIELVLPSISNPSESTMNSIETNLGKLIIRGSIRVISVSVSCLSELIHRHTRNEQLANDMFKRFLRIIRSYRANPSSFEANQQAYFLRALYTCGLLAKHFNIEDRDILYQELVFFVEAGINRMRNRYTNMMVTPETMQDERILLKSLEGLGFMFERSPSLMLRESTSHIYRYFMNRAVDLSPNDSVVASICVITNLRNYLQDEVTQEIKSASSIDWSRENLKEMTSSKQEDANSTQSSVIQLYLRDILSCALSTNVEIRKAAIKLIHSVHNGGHINPLSIVPSLIALSSDDDSTIRVRADHILQEIERKYSNFVNMKSKQGVLESFLLNRGKRGFHRLDLEKQMNISSGSDLPNSEQQPIENNSKDEHNINITAKLSNLYAVVATNRQQRRAFINALLRYFDLQTLASTPNMLSGDPNDCKFILEKCTRCDILQYVCDNLMFLPFTLLDEPFFLVHQIGITLSNLVSQAVSQFRDILQLSSAEDEEVEDEEDIEIHEDELSEDSTDAEVTDEEEDPELRKQRKLVEKQNRLRQRKLELRQRKMQQRGLEQNLINAIEAQDNNNEIDDLPVSILQVKDLVASLHRCILLMHCKRVIWDLYGMTEQKFEDYTPNESTKVTDKPTHRKSLDEKSCELLTKMPQTTVHFDYIPFLRLMYADVFNIMDMLDEGSTSMIDPADAPNRHKLKLEYKRFSQLMTR